MKIRKYVGGAVVWSLLTAAGVFGQFTPKTFEAFTNQSITEADNVTPLRGNTAGGDLVQLIWVGPDGQIDVPDSLGSTTDDDSLLGTTHIGYGFPFDPDNGVFASLFRHDLLVPGVVVYMRAWNDSTVYPHLTDYGDSYPYALNSDFDSHNFGLDFREPNHWRMSGSTYFEPVELALFSAKSEAGYVLLRWSTFSESDNLGFHLYRSTSRDSARVRLNDNLIDGSLTSQVHHEYQYRDASVEVDKTYFYWLTDVSVKGVETMHGPVAVQTEQKPIAYTLEPNFPNPFNPTTTISYVMKESGHVRVQVYNIRGQLVRDLVNAEQSAGRFSVVWDGRDMNDLQVPTGTYLCTMETSDYRSFIKMTLAK
jgi:hypothetical protein